MRLLPPLLATVLAALLALPAAATPPGTNGRLLVTRGAGTLVSIPLEGGAATRIARRTFGGAFSPDGRRVAFAKQVGRGSRLFVANADGAGRTRLRRAGRNVVSPAWSPDGTRIAFAAFRGRQRFADLYTIRADGTGLRRLTRSRVGEGSPEWSPDSSTLVHTVSRRVRGKLFTAALRTTPAAGGRSRQLTPFGGRDELDPTWSPDGTRIAFANPTIRFTRSNIGIINADGTGRRTVRTPLFEAFVVWSPDGTRLAFSGDRSAKRGARDIDVYTVRTGGGGLRRITRRPGGDSPVDWQRLP